MSTRQAESTRIDRRTLLRRAATAAGTAVLAGAAPAVGRSAPRRAGTVTLSYWDWLVSQAPWVDNEIRLFEAAHMEIKIKKTTTVTGPFSVRRGDKKERMT